MRVVEFDKPAKEVDIQAMTPLLSIEMPLDVRRLIFRKTRAIFLRVHIVIEGRGPFFELRIEFLFVAVVRIDKEITVPLSWNRRNVNLGSSWYFS